MRYKVVVQLLQLYGAILLFSTANAQNCVRTFYKDSLKSTTIAELNALHGTKKSFDTLYQKQILTALSYFPELNDVNIRFRFKATKTPLASRPTFWSLVRSAKKRTYLVTISTKTTPKLTPILFATLSYNAQIGVLGHELSHIADYSQKGFSKMFGIVAIELFSKAAVDTFESRTDHSCIKHGLGYQLLEWSTAVRTNLNIENWRGAANVNGPTHKERYLNPPSIIKAINSSYIYQEQ